MGIIIRQSIKSSLVSYVGVIIGFVNVLILYPSILNQGQIGIIETIRALVFLLAPFAASGIPQSVLRFFPTYSINGKDNGFYISLLIILLSWLVVFYLIIFLFKDFFYAFLGYDSANLQSYDWLIFLSLFCYIIYNFLATVSSSSLRITIPRLLDTVVMRIIVMGLVLLFGFSFITLNDLIVFTSIAYVLPAIVLIFYILRMKVISWSINYDVLKWVNFKLIFKYSNYTLFASASSIIIQKIDVVMIGIGENLDSVGIYVIAFYIGSAIEIPSRNIADISFPILSRAFQNNDIKEVENIYKKSSINQFIIGGLLLMIVWSCLDNLFSLMPNGQLYSMGKNVVFIISVGKLLDMIMGVNSKIIQASDFYRYNLYTNVLLSILVVIFNYLLIPKFSIEGAAVASLMALSIYNIVSYIVVWRKLRIQPLSKQSLTVSIIVITLVMLGFILPDLNSSVLSIVYKTVILTFAYGCSIYFLKISPDANMLLKKLLKKTF